MGLFDIIKTITTGDIAIIVIALISLVQISPIKIDPWSWLLRWFGKSMLDDMMNLGEQKDADAARNRILIFDDELRRHIDHSYEYFQQILADVDEYTRYCNEHESYPNSKAEMAIKHIKNVYDKCKENDNFI